MHFYLPVKRAVAWATEMLGNRAPLAVVAVALSASSPVEAWSQDAACRADTVPRLEISAQLRTAAQVQGEFDITAPTNWTRFYSAFYLGLVRDAMARRPDGGVLVIPADSLFWEFLPIAGLVDPAAAPADLLWGRHLGASTFIAYRPAGIVREVREGVPPRLAANVRIAWPDTGDVQEEYTFVDTLSVPQLKVTNQSEVTFRQLDFGDMVVHDQIDGSSVRPLTGLLAQLFKLIGEGSLKYARSAVADDGTQVMRGAVKKIVTVSATVTVYPDGRAYKDVPEGRPDLAALEDLLTQELEIEYEPYRCW